VSVSTIQRGFGLMKKKQSFINNAFFLLVNFLETGYFKDRKIN